MAGYESAIKPAGQLKKKTQKNSKQTTTCHNDWGYSMQREYALDSLFTDMNLFPEYANIKTRKSFETPLSYLAAENFKHLHRIHSYFSKLIGVFPGLVLYYIHAHLWDLVL